MACSKVEITIDIRTGIDAKDYSNAAKKEHLGTMRVELIGHVKPCMNDIYLHSTIDGLLYPQAPAIIVTIGVSHGVGILYIGGVIYFYSIRSYSESIFTTCRLCWAYNLGAENFSTPECLIACVALVLYSIILYVHGASGMQAS